MAVGNNVRLCYLGCPRLLLEWGKAFVYEHLIDVYILLSAGVVQIQMKYVPDQRVHLDKHIITM